MISFTEDGIGLRTWVIYAASVILALAILMVAVVLTGGVPRVDLRVLL